MNAYTISIDGHSTFMCSDDKSVMRTMCEKRIGPIHNGCCGGGCGICKMRVEKGSYSMISKMSRAHISLEEESQKIVLLCCIVPTSDLYLSPL